MVDLTKTDTYEGEVPDEHVEIALRVIRTIRDVALSDMHKPDAIEVTLVLSHAHKHITVMTVQAQEDGREQYDYSACVAG